MSQHYNHPYWPSPRAARIAKLLLEQHKMPSGLGLIFEEAWVAMGHPVKPEGRLTHAKALKLMADHLGLTVHEFLHIKPLDALQRLKLAKNEDDAREIIGDNGISYWWILGGGNFQRRLPCCVCDRILDPPAPAPAPAPEPEPEPEPEAEPETEAEAEPETEDLIEKLRAYISTATGTEIDRYELAAIITSFNGQTAIINSFNGE